MSFIQEIKDEIYKRSIAPELLECRAEGERFATQKIPRSLPDKLPCIKEFCCGVFLSSARGGIQIGGNSSGYHIEFGFESTENARAFCDLLAGFEVLPKLTERRLAPVIYIKSSDCICNLLALIGANKALMTLSNEIALRTVRNSANRKANCDSYNIEKQVAAAAKQVQAIKKLQAAGQLKNLDEKLREVVDARLANPNANYEELACIVGISKSGVMHRLRRLLETSF